MPGCHDVCLQKPLTVQPLTRKKALKCVYIYTFLSPTLGLHRYTRQLAELCCHTDSSNPTVPVKLPFVGDFFLMGAFDEPDLTCLPIENTHVRGYNEYPFINPT